MKIFILDDREENLEAAREALSQYGEIFTATSFVEGQRLVNEIKPDLAFVDKNFPNSNGEEESNLGEKFRDEVLFPMCIPTAIVTGGINHGQQSAYITSGVLTTMGLNVIRETQTLPGVEKTHKESWEAAYQHIISKPFDIYVSAWIFSREMKRNLSSLRKALGRIA